MSHERAWGSGTARLLRGSFVALATVVLGLGAHVGAGGSAPSLGVVALIAASLTAACVVLSRHRWTARPLAAAFLLSQAGLHLASVVQHPDAVHGGAAMALTHAVAAALLVLMVTRGEAALASLVDHLALRAARVRVAAIPTSADGATVVRPTSWATALLRGPAQGRAPPAALPLPAR